MWEFDPDLQNGATSMPARSPFVLWTSEVRMFALAFSGDWLTAMTGGASVIAPFGNIILRNIHRLTQIPEPALLIVSACLFIAASFRVWRREHRTRLADPLLDLKEQLEAFRKHWKQHEESMTRGLGRAYFPLGPMADIEHWNVNSINGHLDRHRLKCEAEAIGRIGEQLAERLPIDAAEFQKLIYPQFSYAITGNQLDELIRVLDTNLTRAILIVSTTPQAAPKAR